jgi:hypothetical protein
MRYTDEQSALWEMYEEVLTKAIDNEAIETVHPSFVHIIAQLSRDEAWMLLKLKETPHYHFVAVVDRDPLGIIMKRVGVLRNDFPTELLARPESFWLYQSHLIALNLVQVTQVPADPHTDPLEPVFMPLHQTRIELTEFGRLFVSATIPPGGFRDSAASQLYKGVRLVGSAAGCEWKAPRSKPSSKGLPRERSAVRNSARD